MLSFSVADGVAVGTQAASLGVRPSPIATSFRIRGSVKRRLHGVCLLGSSTVHSFLSRKGHAAAAIDATTDVVGAAPPAAVAAGAGTRAAPHTIHLSDSQSPRQSVSLFSVGASAMHSRSQCKLRVRRGCVATAATISPTAAAAAAGGAAAMSLCDRRDADADTSSASRLESIAGETACAATAPVSPMATAAPSVHAAIKVDNMAVRQQPTASPSPATSAVLRSQGDPSSSYSGSGSESSFAFRSAATRRDSSLRPRVAPDGRRSRGGATIADPFLRRSATASSANPDAGSGPGVPGCVAPLSGAALTDAIMKCDTWQELAQVLVPAAAILNRTHVAAALVRLAKMQETTGAAGRRAASDPGQGLATGHWQRRRRRQRRRQRRITLGQLKCGRERVVLPLDLVGTDPGQTLDLDLYLESETDRGSSGDGGVAGAAAPDGGGDGPVMAAAYVSREELAVDLARLALTRFLGGMSAREVSNIAWALAQLTPSLVRAPQLASAAVATPQLTPVPGFSRHAAAAALQAACAVHWEGFNTQELVTLLYGMVKLDPAVLDPCDAHRHGAWLGAWFAASERNLDSLGPRGLTVVLWSLVQIWGDRRRQAQEDPPLQAPLPAKWAARMRARLTSQMPHIYPTALVQVAWGLARLQPWLLPIGGLGSGGLPPGAGARGSDMAREKRTTTTAAASGIAERPRSSGSRGAAPAQELGEPRGASLSTLTPASAAESAAAAPDGADTGAAELLALLTRSAIRKAPHLESHRDLAQLSWAVGKLQELVWQPRSAAGRAAARSTATIMGSVEASGLSASGLVGLGSAESSAPPAQRAQIGPLRRNIASAADPTASSNGDGASATVRPSAMEKEGKDKEEVVPERPFLGLDFSAAPRGVCATFRAPTSPAAQMPDGNEAGVAAVSSARVPWQQQEQRQQGQQGQPDVSQAADWSWDQGPVAGWDDVARAEPQLPPTLRSQTAKRVELVSLIARPSRPAGAATYTAVDGAEVPVVQAELRPPTGVPQRGGHESIHALLQAPLHSHVLRPHNPEESPFRCESESENGNVNDRINSRADRTRAGAGDDDEGSWQEQQRGHPPRPAARRLTTTSRGQALPAQQQQQPLHWPQHWQCPENPRRMQGPGDFSIPITANHNHYHHQQQKHPQQRLGLQHCHPLQQQNIRLCPGTAWCSPQPPSRRGKARGGGKRVFGGAPIRPSEAQFLDLPPPPANSGGPQQDRVAQLGRCVLQRWQELCSYATPIAAGTAGHTSSSSRGGNCSSSGLDGVAGHANVMPGGLGGLGGLGGANPYPMQPSGARIAVQEQGAGCQESAARSREHMRAQGLQSESQSPSSPGSTRALERRPTATDVAVMSWACFRLGWKPAPALMCRWAQLALRRPKDFTPQGLANVLQLASTSWETRRLLPSLAAAVLHADKVERSDRNGGRRGGGPWHSRGGDEAADAPASAILAAAAGMRRSQLSLVGAAAPGAVTARALMALARARLRVRHWPRRGVGVATVAGSSQQRRRRDVMRSDAVTALNGDGNVAGARDSWEQSNGRTLAIDSTYNVSSIGSESTGGSSSGSGSSGSDKSDAYYHGDSSSRTGSGGSSTSRRHSDISSCGSQAREGLLGSSGGVSEGLRSGGPPAPGPNTLKGASSGDFSTTRQTGGHASSGGNAKTAPRGSAFGGGVYDAPPGQSLDRQPSARRPRKPAGAIYRGPAPGPSSKDLAAAVASPLDSEVASAAAWIGWRRLIGWLPPLTLCHHAATPQNVDSGNVGDVGDVSASDYLRKQQQQGWSSEEQTDALMTAPGGPGTRVTLSRGATKVGHQTQAPTCTAEDLIVAATAASRLRIRPNRLQLARIHAALIRLPGYKRPAPAAADENDASGVVSGMKAGRRQAAAFGAGSLAVDAAYQIPALEALPGVPDSKLVPLAVALARLQERAFGYPGPSTQRNLAAGTHSDGGWAAAVAAAKAELAEALVLRSTALMRRWQLPLRDLAVLGWAVGVMAFSDEEVSDTARAHVELLTNNTGDGLQLSSGNSLRSASSMNVDDTTECGDAVPVSSRSTWQPTAYGAVTCNGDDGGGNTWVAVDAGGSQHSHAVGVAVAVAGPSGRVSASEALPEWCKVWSESIWAYDIAGAQLPELCAVLSAWAALRWRVDGRMQARVLGRLVPELPLLEAHRLRALSAALESLGWRLPPAWADWLAECRGGSNFPATATAPASAATAVATAGPTISQPRRGRVPASPPAVCLGREEDGKQPVRRLPRDMRTRRWPQ
ncbi:hypothetical protein Vafri_11686 [Volvox africanus]|uniref:Uncharacterized protein n=1 Tax=Volvox africanus TaxID=51714 RepID=A0A8J4B8H4_9CHLO|nr:hypothetical protein Vafri_11686 [Volvox africanus]